MGTIQGALFLFMFRYVFGGAIGTGGELDYVDFLVPGFLVTTILWTGMGAAAGVAEDAATGVYDRLRSLPDPPLGGDGRSLAGRHRARRRGACSSPACSASSSGSGPHGSIGRHRRRLRC